MITIHITEGSHPHTGRPYVKYKRTQGKFDLTDEQWKVLLRPMSNAFTVTDNGRSLIMSPTRDALSDYAGALCRALRRVYPDVQFTTNSANIKKVLGNDVKLVA